MWSVVFFHHYSLIDGRSLASKMRAAPHPTVTYSGPSPSKHTLLEQKNRSQKHVLYTSTYYVIAAYVQLLLAAIVAAIKKRFLNLFTSTFHNNVSTGHPARKKPSFYFHETAWLRFFSLEIVSLLR